MGSARRECLDRTIISGRRHLEWVARRVRRPLQRAASAWWTSAPPPNGRVLEVCRAGEIKCRARLGGLLREYSRTPSLAAARVICTREAFMSISGWSNSWRVGNHDA